ncbi:MAG: Tetratricopeptide repeat protein [Candidatus Methanofastidiosum methylothiophilum]|uniref:Tetratricopeptide repeat protein n=1 Tax=Candidatus Methanofastidiosum methylothiophilum TaxID=1705564 RepID=A0A150IV23_9EURY|nr:MAG: Tetratricopeptide repeat protein [Candidatus Methanofastidiosum methylthiophilus]NMC77666.1 tetratricopeptide repeat protein [Candidatus Methanofastidiosa archaeon]
MKNHLFVLGVIGLLIFSFPVNVNAQEKKRVLIDIAHDEPINFTAGYKIFLDQLTNKGYILSENKVSITESTLSNYDILLIIVPKSNFTSVEISAIDKFVKNGGSLLLVGRGGSSLDTKKTRAVLNELSTNMGIVFNDDLVTDTQSYYDNDATNVIVINMIEDPITTDLYKIAMKLPCSLTISPTSKAIMKGSAQSLSRPYLSDPDHSNNPSTDPVNKISGTDIIVAAKTNVLTGKVVAIGSSTFLEDHMITKYDHLRLVSNLFNYFSETEIVSTPEEKEYTYSELILAAQDYLANNNYDDAIKMADSAISLDSSKYEPYLIKAEALWSRRKYSDALNEVNKALDRGPGYDERIKALILKGDILLSLGEYEEAQSNFKIAQGLNSDNFGVWYGLARAEYNLGNYQESLEAINIALDIEPTNKDANTFKSMLESIGDDNRINEAASYYRIAEESYLAGDYKKSRENYVKSLNLYSELGDQEKVNLIESRISLIDQKQIGKNSVIAVLVVLVLFGIGLVALLIYLIKPDIFPKKFKL